MSAPDFKPVRRGPLTDEELLHLHEHALADRSDDGGNYKMLPLVLLFFFSGLIFFGGTYLNFFSGHFDPLIYDERALPHAGELAAAKIDPAAQGAVYYKSLCIQCHQANGLGQPTITPPLAKSEWVNGSEEVLIRIVLNGLKGSVSVAGTTFPGTAVVMPAVGAVPNGAGWPDEKIAAVLTYIRQDFGNTAGPVTAEQVAAVHAKVGSRATSWTEAELKALQ